MQLTKSIYFLFSLTLVIATSCNSKKDNNVTNMTDEKTNVVAESSNDESKMTILFFGNSLTAGYGLAPEESFPSRIEDKIDSLGLGYDVINGGLSGETTSGGLNRIDWVLRQPVDIFVLELGANDMLRGLPIEETKKNLKGIMDKVKEKYPDCKIILAEMMAAPNMGKEYGDQFLAVYRDLAKSENVDLMPFFLQDLQGKADLILPDGKHPNADGQKIVANYIWNYLKTKL